MDSVRGRLKRLKILKMLKIELSRGMATHFVLAYLGRQHM